MQRDEFYQRMNELLDQRLRPQDDPHLSALAALHEEFRQALAAQELLLDRLDMGNEGDLPADFSQRVVSQRHDGAGHNPPRPARRNKSNRWKIARWVIGSAALSVAVIGGGYLLSVWGERNVEAVDGSNLAVSTNDSENLAEDKLPSDELLVSSPKAAEARETAAAEARETAPSPSSSPLDLQGLEDENAVSVAAGDHNRYQAIYETIAAWRSTLPADSEETLSMVRAQWVEDLAGGLKPVAASVGGALNVIRRNLPPASKSDPLEEPQALRMGDRGELFS